MADALRYLIRVTLGVSLFAFVVGLRAQPVQGLQFTVFSARPITGLAFAPRNTGARQPIVFYPTARSPRYDYRGPMPLRFVDNATGATLAEASVPAEMHHVLLLFMPIAGAASAQTKETVPQASSLRYRIAVIDDTAAPDAAGRLTILNLSGLPLAGTVAEKSVTLESGLNSPLAIGRRGTVILQTSYKNRSYHSYRGEVELGPRQRASLILFPPFNKGSLEVQSRLLVDEPPAVSR